MRKLIVLSIILFSLIACNSSDSVDKGKTTNTLSNVFSTHQEKVDFLKRYVKLKRTYNQLDFHVIYNDNSTGRVPGPSEWDITLIAIVPDSELDSWIAESNKQIENLDTKWLSRIPTDIDYSVITKWHELNYGAVAGISRNKNLVVYRNRAN